MSFLVVFFKMGLIGIPFLGAASLLWMKYHPAPQGLPDVEKVSGLFERFGVPTVLLIFLGFLLWKLAKWSEPRASALIDTTLDKAAALPGLLDENRKSASAQEARDKAIVHTMEMAMELIKDLRERVDAQSKRTQLMAETMVVANNERSTSTAAISALTIQVQGLISILQVK